MLAEFDDAANLRIGVKYEGRLAGFPGESEANPVITSPMVVKVKKGLFQAAHGKLTGM